MVELPEGCGDRASVQSLLEEELKGVTLPERNSTLGIELRGQKRGKRTILRLITRDRELGGERTLRGRDCQELVHSAVVIVSLALAPDLIFRNELERNELGEDQTTLGSDASAKPSVAQKPTTPQRQIGDDELPGSVRFDDPLIRHKHGRDSEEGFEWSLLVGGKSDVGLMPGTALAGRMGVRARSGKLWFDISLARSGDQSIDIESLRPGRGAHFDYLAGELALCRSLFQWQSELAVCALGSVGRMVAGPQEIDNPIEQAHLLPSLGGEILWQQELGTRLRLLIGASGLVQLVRPRYTLEVVPDTGLPTDSMTVEVHHPALVAGGLRAGLELRFW